ncbi:MAG: gamma-glutamylputrescine oxidase [Candidatus Latescibacterota bacterium]|jgi:gamma-glutamylputrescine oxidase
MNLSYWEQKTWLADIDFAVIGSGIVGLSCALSLRKAHPLSKIVVFEKGMLPSGASTKNAGFACFGSISEILSDLKTHTEEEVVELVQDRVNGLKLLRNTLGDASIDYQEEGGYELFSEANRELFNECIANIDYINKLLHPVFGTDVFFRKATPFNFQNVHSEVIFNQFEGQLDTGKMMSSLLRKTSEMGILVLNSAQIDTFSTIYEQIHLKTAFSEDIICKQLFIATNGFAKQFLEADIQPARAQVIVTKPIDNLQIAGTFHLDQGYYYFRNIDNRILFGGGRNLDFGAEKTDQTGLTPLVQNTLEELLRTTILPNTPFEIDTRWSGIMGVGQQKKPIIKAVAPNIYCGVRLGGMGVAIGSSVGQQLANLSNE